MGTLLVLVVTVALLATVAIAQSDFNATEFELDLGSPDCRNVFGAVVSIGGNINRCALLRMNIKGTKLLQKPLPGVCDSSGPKSVPVTAYNAQTRMMFFATGTNDGGSGRNVYVISNARATASLFGQLPPSFNHSLGMQYVVASKTLYYVTQDAIYASQGGGAAVQFALHRSLNSFDISQDAVMTGDGTGRIFIIDGSMLHISTLAIGLTISHPIPNLAHPIDLQWWGAENGLLVVDSGTLYFLSPSTLTVKSLYQLNASPPDYGRVNALNGNMWWFSDKQRLFTMQLSTTQPIAAPTSVLFGYSQVEGWLQHFS